MHVPKCATVSADWGSRGADNHHLFQRHGFTISTGVGCWLMASGGWRIRDPRCVIRDPNVTGDECYPVASDGRPLANRDPLGVLEQIRVDRASSMERALHLLNQVSEFVQVESEPSASEVTSLDDKSLARLRPRCTDRPFSSRSTDCRPI